MNIFSVMPATKMAFPSSQDELASQDEEFHPCNDIGCSAKQAATQPNAALSVSVSWRSTSILKTTFTHVTTIIYTYSLLCSNSTLQWLIGDVSDRVGA
jgi:hypothetical protein